MLRPAKHAHPDQTALYLAALLITHLKRRRIETYGELLQLAKTKVRGGDALFLPAVEVLYLLGLIEYRRKADSFEFVGPEQ
jgi:hypothetical protein